MSAAAAKRQARNEYAGLTVSECCNGCNADGCVISGKNYCAHPRKGGLQGADQGDAVALQRLQHAQKVLAKRAVDKRFS